MNSKPENFNSNPAFPGENLLSPGASGLSPGESGLSPGASDLSPGASSGENLPRYHKRAFAHNYRAPFIYHIILKKKEDFIKFGSVRGDARIAPGLPGSAFVEESDIGKTIAKSIIGIQRQFSILQIYQFIVMPDHVHILLRVKDWSERHLDFYIETLVSNITEIYSRTIGKQLSATDIFQPGYCDKPLLLKRSLDGLFRYIRENPHRLAMRQQFPQFFRRIRKLRIGEKEFEAYGNLFLLRNPDKEAVKISRKFTFAEKEQKKTAWLSATSKGTILVSPFISPAEKAIRVEAEALGAKIILITHEAFPERYKPSAHDFALCEEGRLLIISLGYPTGTPLSRAPLFQRSCALCNRREVYLHCRSAHRRPIPYPRHCQFRRGNSYIRQVGREKLEPCGSQWDSLGITPLMSAHHR